MRSFKPKTTKDKMSQYSRNTGSWGEDNKRKVQMKNVETLNILKESARTEAIIKRDSRLDKFRSVSESAVNKSNSKQEFANTIKNKFKAHNNSVNECFYKFIGSVVLEALPLDKEEKLIPQNTEKILEETTKVVELFKDSGVLNVKNSDFFSSILESIEAEVKNIETVKDTGEELDKKEIMQVVDKVRSDEIGEVQELAGKVEDKVVDAVKNENYITEKSEQLKEQKLFVPNNKTLMRFLTEKSHEKIMIQESDALLERISPKELQDVALVEAMITYTILETLNTTNTITADQSKMKGVIRFS